MLGPGTADCAPTPLVNIGMPYGKLITDARFYKSQTKKNSFRTVVSAVGESAVCLHLIVLQHKGEWRSFLSELMPLIEPSCNS